MERSGFTIAAPITPKGIGAVAGIRLSGSECLPIFLPFVSLEPEKLIPGKLTTAIFKVNGLPLDEITFCYKKAPATYTGEDTIEIFCHGGWVMPNLIMDHLLENGAVYAQPGEFSQRAFENGKLDLIKLESIQQLVHSRTKQEAVLAGSGLFGRYQKEIKALSENIIELKSYLEAQISFPLDMEEEKFPLEEKISQINDQLITLIQQAKMSELYRNGFEVLIIGKTNVGKSSLFNSILGWNRMMVSPYPSTTHDYVTELIELHGYPVYLVDSAGYIKNGDGVDKLFNETLPGKIEQSFLVLFVLDASSYQAEDLDLIQQYSNKKKIIVINKSDLNESFPVNEISERFPHSPAIIVSSVTKEGLFELMEEVYNQIQEANPEKLDYYINERQQHSIIQCNTLFQVALAHYREGSFLDMIASDVDRAAQWLDELLGYALQEASYQKIFDTFCIGK